MKDPFEKRVEDSLKDIVDSHIEKGIRGQYTAQSNYASQLGFRCDTFHALVRNHGELRPRVSLGLQRIFRAGDVWETPNMRLLQDSGISVKDRIGTYEWKKYNIRGRLDARVEVKDLMLDRSIPFEHKTCSPNSFRSIKAHRDEGLPLTKANQIWLRKYPGQLMIYMLMEAVEWGLWMFFEKTSGDFFFWLLKLDYEYGEELLQRAERANESAATGKIPKPEFKDECKKCDFQLTYCFPDKDFGEGFELITDPMIEEKIRRLKELEKEQKEYSDLKKDIFGDKKAPGSLYGRNAIIGDYAMVENKVVVSSYKKYPDDVKAEKIEYTYYKPSVVILGDSDASDVD